MLITVNEAIKTAFLEGLRQNDKPTVASSDDPIAISSGNRLLHLIIKQVGEGYRGVDLNLTRKVRNSEGTLDANANRIKED